jgi:hypothetical protein
MAAFAAGGGGASLAAYTEDAMAPLAAGEGEIIAPVIFFDNDIRNCQDMIRNVKNCTSVYVDDKSKPDEYSSGKDYMEKQATAENIYAKITMRELGPEPHICKGITDEIISTKLTPWIERTQGVENRFAVFDWDRTISVVEGLAIPSGFPYKGIAEDEFIAHMTTYVLGGDARIQILINIFQNILEKDIKVVILTNNPSAMPTLQNIRQRNTFLKMIKIIIPQFNEVNLLCSYRSPSKSNRFKEYLASLNLLRGGKKRKTKRRRNTKYRRNTKTRRNTKRRWQKRR